MSFVTVESISEIAALRRWATAHQVRGGEGDPSDCGVTHCSVGFYSLREGESTGWQGEQSVF